MPQSRARSVGQVRVPTYMSSNCPLSSRHDFPAVNRARPSFFPLSLSLFHLFHLALILSLAPCMVEVLPAQYTPCILTWACTTTQTLDSDDSDYEGESHVSRLLREYSDKKEAQEVAAKIAELDRMSINDDKVVITPPITPVTPVSPVTPLTPVIPERSESIARHKDLREAIRKNIQVNTSPSVLSRAAGNSSHHHYNMYSPSTLSPLTSSPTTPGGGTKDYYGLVLRARGESGHQPSRSVDGSRNGTSKSHGHDGTRNNTNNGDIAALLSAPASAPALAPASTLAVPVMTNGRINRFRTSSDASLSEALGRLEGKRNQDALLAQVSHLGSTRARSPHRGQRAYRDHIDVVPPPPLPTPKSEFRQQLQLQQHQQHQQQGSLPASSSMSKGSSTSRRAHGQRERQLEQPPSQYI